jgi:hypothetical protein
MLLTVDTPEAEQFLVYDCDGNIIPYVTAFDTETEEVELMIPVKADLPEGAIYDPQKHFRLLMQKRVLEDGTTDSAPIAVKFILRGAYALKNGNPIQ